MVQDLATIHSILWYLGHQIRQLLTETPRASPVLFSWRLASGGAMNGITKATQICEPNLFPRNPEITMFDDTEG